MARIRTIKPEFWEDEKIGALSHGARLLFLCCLNLSDDEGLLRWNAFYLASNAFTYDEIKIETIEKWMKELVDNELIYVYQAGKVKQQIGYIINFHKHQRIDKPQPGKFPPPNYRDSRVKDMIYKRDKGICKLCGNPISEPPKDAPYLEENNRKRMMSCDHIKPRSKGGSDYFSNLQASHLYCNQCKAAKYGEEQVDNENNTFALNNSDNNSDVNSKNHSKNHSTEEKEEEKEDKKESPNGDKKEAVASSPASSNPDFLKFNDWLKRKAPFCSNPKNFSSQITEAEFLKLKEKYTGKQIADIIEQIENRKDLRKRYTNLYRTVLNWAKKEYGS